MAGHKTRVIDQVAGPDRFPSKAQMRNRHRSGFLRIVDKIPLRVIFRIFADDLDGILVRAHRSIRSEAIKHGAHSFRIFGGKRRIVIQTSMRNVVVNAHHKMIARLGFLQLVENRRGHRGRELLARQAITPADHARPMLKIPFLLQRHQSVLIERLTGAARLLSTVQHRDCPHRRRQGCHQSGCREGPEQMNVDQSNFLALFPQRLDALFRRERARSHHHDHALGVRRSKIIEQPVLAAGQRRKAIHGALHDIRRSFVKRIHSFARLKINIRILRRAPQHRPVRIQRSRPMRPHQLIRDHGAHVFDSELFHLGHFVRSAEAIKEMHERQPGFQRRRMRDQRHIHHGLHGMRPEQRKTCLAHRHDILVIAEDRQSLSRQCPRRHMENRGRQLPRDLVHVGDHQQQPLRRRKCSRQGPALQRPMYRSRRAPFALHLHHGRDRSPHIGASRSGPLVRPFPHRGRGGNGVDRDDLAQMVGHIRGRLITVNSYLGSFCGGHATLNPARRTPRLNDWNGYRIRGIWGISPNGFKGPGSQTGLLFQIGLPTLTDPPLESSRP